MDNGAFASSASCALSSTSAVGLGPARGVGAFADTVRRLGEVIDRQAAATTDNAASDGFTGSHRSHGSSQQGLEA